MRTRCPECQTAFRVTPDQLKARAGKVRCGQCQAVFNALDHLLDETNQVAEAPATSAPPRPITPASVKTNPVAPPTITPVAPAPAIVTHSVPIPKPTVASEPRFLDFDDLPPFEPLAEPTSPDEPVFAPFAPITAPEPAVTAAQRSVPPTEKRSEPTIFFTTDDLEESEVAPEVDAQPLPTPPADTDEAEDEDEPPLSEAAAQELGKATGMILPRETTEIPGYSKWSEDPLSQPFELPDDPPSRWPGVLFAMLLVIALCVQAIFHFRTEIVIALPGLRPAIAATCEAFGADIPLPRRGELVSIEVSDLQTDREHNNLLALHATLRNRAPYAQAYPMLELALTDTQDAAIVRRVIKPAEYLSPKISPDAAFPANGDLAVRLWIDASSVVASGYRLYVFYP